MEHYHISSIPIVDYEKISGHINEQRYTILEDYEIQINEVMTKEPLITGKAGTTLEEAKIVLHKNRIEKLPLVDDNYVLKGLITIKDIEKARQYPNACKDNNGRLRVGAAVGVTSDVFNRVEAIAHAHADVIVVDTAHADSERVLMSLKESKKIQY